MNARATIRAINWRIVFALTCFVVFLILASIGWGVLVHWLAHCS